MIQENDSEKKTVKEKEKEQWLGTLDLELVRWSIWIGEIMLVGSKVPYIYIYMYMYIYISYIYIYIIYPRFQDIPRSFWNVLNISKSAKWAVFIVLTVSGRCNSQVEGFDWNTSKARGTRSGHDITRCVLRGIARYEKNSRSPSAFDLPGSGHWHFGHFFLHFEDVC